MTFVARYSTFTNGQYIVVNAETDEWAAGPMEREAAKAEADARNGIARKSKEAAQAVEADWILGWTAPLT